MYNSPKELGSNDSDIEDMEIRLYSELFFEQNPDYVPQPAINVSEISVKHGDCDTEIKPMELEYAENVDSALARSSFSNNKINIESNGGIISTTGSGLSLKSTALLNKKSRVGVQTKSNKDDRFVPVVRGRQRLLSNSSVQSIPGSVELNMLYCRSDGPVHEEHNHEQLHTNLFTITEAAEAKVNNWKCEQIKLSKSKTKNYKSKNKRLSNEVDDVIEIDPTELNKKVKYPSPDVILIDSDSDTQEKYTEISEKPKNKNLKSKGIKNFLSCLNDIKSCKTKSKSYKSNKTKRSNVSEFVMDISGESSAESVELNGSIITNMAYNHSTTTRSLPISEIYEDEVNVRNCIVNKSVRISKRTKWPLDYTATRQSSVTQSPALPHWSPHMVSFYDSDVSEEFDLDHIHKRMPRSIVEWELEDEDLPFSQLKRKSSGRKRYFEKGCQRCTRCRSTDHTVRYCNKFDYCHLCGATDHSKRTACPHNCCLRCGAAPHTFCQQTTAWTACRLCHRKGHVVEACPDVWRRYCYTTSGSAPVVPAHPRPQLTRASLSCFSCGGRGHLGPNCAHKVTNYVVLGYDVISYDSPVENSHGNKTLRVTDREEDEEESHGIYGPLVQVLTPCRAKISLKQAKVGLLIGRKGVVIKTLEKLSDCEISIKNTRGAAEVWIYGETIDPAIRACLFLLGLPTDYSDLDEYAAVLDNKCGVRFYTNQLATLKGKQKPKQQLKANEIKDTIECLITDSESVHSSEVEVISNVTSKLIKENKREVINPQNNKRKSTEILSNSAKRLYSQIETPTECDSKYAALDKIKSKANRFAQLSKNRSLTDSEDNSSDDSVISDLNRTMEDYVDNCDGDQSSDSEYSTDNVESSSGNELADIDSDNEVFDSESDAESDFCELDLTPSYIADLNKYKMKMRKAHLQMMPNERVSLIEVIKLKLNELNKMTLDYESVVKDVKEQCQLYNCHPNTQTLRSLEDKVRNLGQFVLGKLQLGYGKDFIKDIKQRLWQLQNETGNKVSVQNRKELVKSLMEVFEVSLDDVDLVIELLAANKNEIKMRENNRNAKKSKKESQQRRPTKNSPKNEDTQKSLKKLSKKKSLDYPVTFRSIEELSSWSSTPQTRKSRKSLASHLSSSLKKRLDFTTSPHNAMQIPRPAQNKHLKKRKSPKSHRFTKTMERSPKFKKKNAKARKIR